ncbi:S49 family peptidase, partial [Acinetobacter baumannii]
KPVLAYATAYTDSGYRLAANASEVWMSPMGGTLFMGPGGSQLYYKGLIDKLGINAHVYRVGKYKSFVEPYTRTDASP